MSAEHTSPEGNRAASTRGGRYMPGRLALFLILLAVAGIIVAQATDFTGDHGVTNVLTFVLSVIAGATLVIWFVFRSAYPLRIRYGFLALLALLAVVAAAIVRVDEVTGEMVPSFRFFWQERPDMQLAKASATDVSADLARTTALDFPQFLGTNRDGQVHTLALSPDWTGNPPRLVWKQPIGAGWSAFSAVNGYAVTMEQRGEEELVTCYEIATGKLVWSHATPARHETLLGGVGPRGTPTIDGGRVYALGATGVLRCLDGANGRAVWTRDLLQEFGVPAGADGKQVGWGRAASPLIVDDLVVVPAGGPAGKAVSLVAYRKLSGEQAWVAGNRQVSYSSPILATLNGQRQVIVVNEDSVSGHEPRDGRMLWEIPWDGNSTQDANTSQPHVVFDGVLVTKGYGGGCARFTIDGSQSKLVFHHRSVLKTKLTSAVLDGSFAYGLSDGILECVDVNDGHRQWKAGRYGHGQILLVGGHLLVLTESGELVLLEGSPERHRELGRIPALTGKTWNNLCLYGRFLLIRNAEEAACFELPLREAEAAPGTAAGASE